MPTPIMRRDQPLHDGTRSAADGGRDSAVGAFRIVARHTRDGVTTMSEQAMDGGTSKTHARPWLRLVHIACVAVALLTMGLFVAGLPLYYDVLRTPCSA